MMTKIEILELIKPVLHKCLLDDDIVIELDSHLYDDLGLDSMGTVDFVVNIESDFDITLSESEIQSIKTVQDAVNMIIAKLADR